MTDDVAPPLDLTGLTAANTSPKDVADIVFGLEEHVPFDLIKRLNYFPAAGRGLNREDIKTILSWGGVASSTENMARYIDVYRASGVPDLLTDQLAHCRMFARDLRYRLTTIHSESIYGVDHSYD